MSKYVGSGREATVDYVIDRKKPVQSEAGASFANPNHVQPGIRATDASTTAQANGGLGIEDNDVLTVIEAAALLRVHPVTLRKKATAWGVPHRRLGSEWRFSRMVLTAWMRERDAA
jgi:excisionase family DNA binding protein